MIDCVFCEYGSRDLGFKDKRGATKIYETGKNPQNDWYGFLQDSVTSDPETGFRLLLLPVGHIEHFYEVNLDAHLAQNLGTALARLSFAMHRVRSEEFEDWFNPNQIVYGKCGTPENTKPHLHIKLDEFSGGLAQAYPSDAGWVKKTTESDGIGLYVRAMPVTQVKLSTERVDTLAERLMAYLP